MFIRPQKFSATVVKKINLNARIIELTLKLNNRNNINFSAGQFVSLEVSEGEYRAYSIASPETYTQQVRLLIDVVRPGKGADLAKSLKVGESVNIVGPSGKFTLPNMLPKNLVFVATGVGFAPFESMLQKLKELKYPGKIDFFFGIRNYHDLFKEAFLKTIAQENNNFKYYLCFSQKHPEHLQNVYKGRVTKVLPEILDKNIYKSSLFMLCGNAGMIHDLVEILQNHQVNSENILFEKFT